MADPFDPERFIAAQAPVMDQVRGELRRGKKTSHWMWFVFPQLAALGTSTMAKRYGIGSVAQAQAYLADPTLGPACSSAAACCCMRPATTSEISWVIPTT